MVKDAALAEKIGFLQNAMGTCAGPQDCFLVLRGIKTLAIRMEEHNRNSLAIARWLEKHPKVLAVLHPGLKAIPSTNWRCASRAVRAERFPSSCAAGKRR